MYQNFTSLPPHEEQTFIVYEQRMAEAGSKGLTMGAVAGAIILVIAVGIYLGVDPKEIDYTKDMNMSNLTKKEKTSSADTPAPTPAPAVSPTPTPAPTTPAAPAGTAPAAPAGTTPAAPA